MFLFPPCSLVPSPLSDMYNCPGHVCHVPVPFRHFLRPLHHTRSPFRFTSELLVILKMVQTCNYFPQFEYRLSYLFSLSSSPLGPPSQACRSRTPSPPLLPLCLSVLSYTLLHKLLRHFSARPLLRPRTSARKLSKQVRTAQCKN